MKKAYFPTNAILEDAILDALKKLGGVADVPAINTTLIETLQLPKDVVELEDESGLGTKLDYRLRWCRTKLKAKGKIENVKRGTWRLVSE